MLIRGHEVLAILNAHGIVPTGVLHIGAHECEEKDFYNTILQIPDNKIVWIDANPVLVDRMRARGHLNVYQGAISYESKELDFNVSNNGQSSSLLDFGLHEKYHSHVHYVAKIKVQTETLAQFYARNEVDGSAFDFWNLDIQGVEYDVLRAAAADGLLEGCKAIYSEVNTGEVYKGCGLMSQIDELLAGHGFKRVRTEMTRCEWGDALYIKA